MSSDLARVIEGEYALAAAPPPPRFSAKEALEVNSELQAFIRGLMSHPSTWPKINGKPNPPATELMKLWSPLGCESEIVSRNEHGELGVRRELVKLPGGAEDVKFSVTMRVTARRLGAGVTVAASQMLSEKQDRSTGKPLPEGNVEAQAQTRAKNRALKTLAGFDVADMTKPPVQEQKLDGAALVARAAALRVIPRVDKEMFLDWAQERVQGCKGMTTFTVRHRNLIVAHLDALEDLA